MEILIRADDLGYSEAVNYGIFKTAKDGIINNIGLMSNMEKARHGYQLVSDLDICLGLHANISAGKPISDPAEIPSLVNDECFKNSRNYNKGSLDIVNFEEAFKEIQKQVDLFKTIVGYSPRYIDFHAVFNQNFISAVKAVADMNNIPFVGISSETELYTLNNSTLQTQIAIGTTQQELFDSFRKIIAENKSGCFDLIIYHPGFIDADLLMHSSLTEKRVYETAFLTSNELKTYISREDITLKRLDLI